MSAGGRTRESWPLTPRHPGAPTPSWPRRCRRRGPADRRRRVQEGRRSFVGDDREVRLAVAVQVPHHDLAEQRSDEEGLPGGEGEGAGPCWRRVQEYRHGAAHVIGDDEVGLAVAVEVG